MKRIFYLVTDNPKPSWGVGIIYYHVSILVQHGFNAKILHNHQGFKIGWLNLHVPVLYYPDITFSSEDILIIPEVMATNYDYSKLNCKKILFVQGLSYLFYNFKYNQTHYSQGFISAIIIMPHMNDVVSRYTGLPIHLLPPFIASYFFKEKDKLHDREKLILIYPKQQLAEYTLIKHILLSSGIVYPNTFLNRNFKTNWRLIEMHGLSHEENAQLMKRASFLITTNSFEAFNTSVPESMAAGCINICYDAIGPKDFLNDGHNAYVFNNNHAIELAEKVIELVNNYDILKNELDHVRNMGRLTADKYSFNLMEQELISYYHQFMSK